MTATVRFREQEGGIIIVRAEILHDRVLLFSDENEEEPVLVVEHGEASGEGLVLSAAPWAGDECDV